MLLMIRNQFTYLSQASTNKTSNNSCYDDINIISTWYLDSSATQHMTPNQNWFSTYEKLNPIRLVFIGDDTSHQTIDQGPIKVKLPSSPIAIISYILYLPSLARNFLILGQILEKRSNFTFNKGLRSIPSNNKIFTICKQEGNLFPLDDY